ncbi:MULTISPECIES: hypothetical protein [Flavobacterium]|uniref:Uncharacterized protein n=1 Tax=Flavobacterium lipolyticum TaxID=2893754 RepID=A0ABS8M3Y8_9FLAO|nr:MULTISPECIES: hypothetical protein [unclassified Flavobacterium]MCC9019414.1 hypothetical protein [Flavobacterium sp. F-126]
MEFNGVRSIEECSCLSYNWEVKSNGTHIGAIISKNEYLIYDIKPTSFEYMAYRPDSYACSGPCRDDYYEAYADHNLNADCYPPYFIGNQVLTKPNNLTNSFCDRVLLAAVGCTGTQKFYWEYSTNGKDFIKTDISTNFNQNYDFVKSNFPALNNYYGTILFRVLIDSNPDITEENVYSNVVNYTLIPCSPKLDNTSTSNYTTCSYSNGSVVFTFSRPLEKDEKYLFNRNPVGGGAVTSANSNDPDIEKVNTLSYKWKNIPAGNYNFKYQTQFESGSPSSMSTVTNFTISPRTPLTFTSTAVQPYCSTDPKGILITATGGTPPYYYLLDDEPLSQKHLFSNGYIIPITTDGEHKVMVVDNSNCIEN